MSEVTIADIERIASQHPTQTFHYRNLTWSAAPPPYEEWTEAVEEAILQSCEYLSVTKDRVSRPRLSDCIRDLATNLALLGFNVYPSNESLLVRLSDYKWIGSGASDGDFSHATAAASHLVTNQLDGTTHRRRGGLLLFCTEKDAVTSLGEWRRLVERDSPNSHWTAGSQSFVATSVASSPSSGLQVVLVHIAIALHVTSSPQASALSHSTDLVVLVHGIRTHAGWEEMVRERLTSAGIAKVVAIRYGYFDAFRFLFPLFTRRAPIIKVIRELRDINADNPGKKISVIAHSFGTYAISKALDERELRFHRVIFCGSIVGSNFRRNAYRGQLGDDDIVNDCGSKDIWPILANALTFGYGPTGTVGFGTHGIRDRFHPFRHSDFFDGSFVDTYWSPFLVSGQVNVNPWEARRPALGFVMGVLSSPLVRYLVAAVMAAAVIKFAI